MKNIKDILKDKEKVRKITERAFHEIDLDHQGAISFNELVSISFRKNLLKSRARSWIYQPLKDQKL